MALLNRWLIWIVWAVAALPANSLAFVVTPQQAVIEFANADPTATQVVTFTVSGQLSNLNLFALGIKPDFTVIDEDAARLGIPAIPGLDPLDYEPCRLNSMTYTETLALGIAPLACAVFNDVESLGAPLLFILVAQPDPTCDPVTDICGLVPFSLADGPFLTFDLVVRNQPGETVIPMTVCQSDDCIPGEFGSGPIIPLSASILIQRRDGTAVPEPATLWLAFAALIAGGAVFRNGSKRS